MTESERSGLPLVLWIASAVFIVYGTTIPFNFVHDRQLVADHFARLSWNPFIAVDTGERVSIPDFAANILLFGPFGFLGMLALPRPRALAGRIALVTGLGLGLTVGVEALQLLTIDRTSSMSDIVANTSGALAGGLAAVLLSTFVEGFLRTVSAAGVAAVPSFFPLLIATLVLLAGKLEPFDATLDIGSLIPKVRGFLADPIQLGVPIDEGMSLLQHALFTGTLVVWLKEIRIERAATVAVVVGAAVALVTEAGQLFIGTRMPGLWDAGVGITGALAGVTLGAAFVKSKKNPNWWVGVFLITLAGVAMQQLSPFTLSDDTRSFQWIPFLNYYELTSSQTVSHSAELLLAYFPLGFSLAMTTRRRRRRFHVVVAAVLLIAVPVECLQMYIGGRFPDVTDIALSVAGAWLGAWTATRGWRRFDQQIALFGPEPAVTTPVPAS